MADTLKVLAQVAPSATTETTLYTVPGATSTSVSSLTICNRSASATTFRLYVAVAGAVTDNKMYIYYDQAIDGNSTYIATIGLTLAATDVVKIYAGAATLSFNLYGVEVT